MQLAVESSQSTLLSRVCECLLFICRMWASVGSCCVASPAAPMLCVNDTMPSTHSLRYSFVLGDDGNSPITQVTISCYEVKINDQLDTSNDYRRTSSDFASSGCTSDEVTGLSPGTKYGCQLYAANDVGNSGGGERFDYTTAATGE